MKFLLLACLFFCSVFPVFSRSASEDNEKQVFILPVKGPIDKGMLYVFRRAFREAEELKPTAVILELNTPGGGLKETREIIDWIRSVRRKGTPVYAFINPDALSAGAMLCMATDGVYMMEQATVGSAMPIALSPFSGNVQSLPEDVKEKMMSAVRGMVRSLAQENHFREDIVVAMVDPGHPDIDYPGVLQCPKGEILNLTARQAISLPPGSDRPIFARAMVSSLDAMLSLIRQDQCRRVYFQEEAADHLARWITAVGPVLFALAVLGLWLEFKTPGFGVFGIGGICLLGIYFFGHFVAGLAGMEELVLIAVGIILLALEIFVIPGFGIAGIAGILCILLGGGLAVVPHLPDGAESLPGLPALGFSEFLPEILRSFVFSVLGICIGGYILSRLLPKTRAYHDVIMDSHLESGTGIDSREQLIGRRGVARTYLRPSGVVVLDGVRYDALSRGEFIEPGTEVVVTAVENASLLVERPAAESTQPAGETTC